MMYKYTKNQSNLVKSDAQTISELKEKLHKSFLQISDIQKIYEGQLQSQRQLYQNKISLLEKQNKNLKNKTPSFQKKASLGLDASYIIGKNNNHNNNALFSSQMSLNNSFLNDSIISTQPFQGLINWVKTDSKNNNEQYMSLMEKSITESLNFVPKQLLDYFRMRKVLQDENNRYKQEIKKLKQEKEANELLFQSSIKERKRLEQNLQKAKFDNMKIAQMYQEQLTKNRNLEMKLKPVNFQKTARTLRIQDPQQNNENTQSSKIKLSSIVSPRNIMRKSEFHFREKE